MPLTDWYGMIPRCALFRTYLVLHCVLPSRRILLQPVLWPHHSQELKGVSYCENTIIITRPSGPDLFSFLQWFAFVFGLEAQVTPTGVWKGPVYFVHTQTRDEKLPLPPSRGRYGRGRGWGAEAARWPLRDSEVSSQTKWPCFWCYLPSIVSVSARQRGVGSCRCHAVLWSSSFQHHSGHQRASSSSHNFAVAGRSLRLTRRR